MNQLDYQPAFNSGSLPSNQALSTAPYAGFQQNYTPQTADFNGGQNQQQSLQQLQQQHHQQQQQHPAAQFQQTQQLGAQNGMFNVSPVQPAGPFSSAPYAQSIPASAQQQQHSSLRQSASPQQPNSPFTQSNQQQQQQIKYPMAAPPLPQTPVNASNPQYPPQNVSTPTTPQSPGADQRETERIQLLFEINAELIQEISSLQSQGKGGAINPQQQVQLKAANMDDSMASEEYIATLRRVQANLSYLAAKGNLSNVPSKSMLPGPAHMTPPSNMPQLQSKYDRLKGLFPGWNGMENRATNAPRPAANGVVS